MELYQEILRHILAEEKIQVSFPELTNSDSTKIVELECYRDGKVRQNQSNRQLLGFLFSS